MHLIYVFYPQCRCCVYATFPQCISSINKFLCPHIVHVVQTCKFGEMNFYKQLVLVHNALDSCILPRMQVLYICNFSALHLFIKQSNSLHLFPQNICCINRELNAETIMQAIILWGRRVGRK